MKLALITGASHGLGAAFALELAPAYHVLAVGRTVGALEELDDRIKAKGGEATLAPMDITNSDAMRQLADAIAARWGRVDLWVHTAVHAAPLGPVAYTDDKDWDKSVACNVNATRTLITQIAPLLAGGRAVFFDDPRAGQTFFGSYGATKAAQIALAKSWQAEAATDKIRVDIVTPDPMATATRARFFPGEARGELATPSGVAAKLTRQLGL
jgi:NAD(P)-dependent dehydrogenase (short-subunit alcohol dehydrogenase family)